MSNIRQVKVKNTRAVCHYHYVSIYVSITPLGSNTVCISAVCIYNVYYQKSNRNPDELTFHWAALTETASSSNSSGFNTDQKNCEKIKVLPGGERRPHTGNTTRRDPRSSAPPDVPTRRRESPCAR